jgi:hypothetical protein
MSSKSSDVYVKIFKHLKEEGCEPRGLIVDFEQSVITAFKEIFENVKIFGCLFHLGQSIWRRVQHHNLVSYYKQNLYFKTAVRMLLALAFVPTDEILVNLKRVEIYIVTNGIKNEMKELFDYFVRNFLGSFDNIGNFLEVKHYNINFWSGFKRVLDRIPLTNNGIEALNMSINLKSAIANPNFCRFINLLQKEEELTRLKIIKVKNGENIHTYNSKSVVKNQKLRDLIENFEFIEKEVYLERIIKLYNWKFDLNK